MKKGFKITKAFEITEALIDYRDNYNEKGKYLGFDNLNDLYTMQLGTCTDWTGFPRSGKTQVLMELLLNTSLYYGVNMQIIIFSRLVSVRQNRFKIHCITAVFIVRMAHIFPGIN